MAEIQGSLISELGATTINGTEKIPVEKGPANNHVTTQQVKEFVKQGMKTSELENDSNFATQQNVKDEIAKAQLGGGGEVDTSGFATKEELAQALTNYVQKVLGKDLSTNDFTNVLKKKLEGLENYDDAAMQQAIQTINTRIDTLVGTSASTAIDTFNEIEAFLQGITDSSSLTAMLAELKSEITALIPNIEGLATKEEVTTVESKIPTTTSQLTNDSNFVADEHYQHTDNNFTTSEKEKLATLKDGSVCTIGEDGFWYIDGVKTDVKAQGVKGDSGVQLGDVVLSQVLDTSLGSENKVLSLKTASELFNEIKESKKIKVLSIGNSYSCDALGYFPYLIPNIEDVGVFAIAMYPGSSLQWHDEHKNEALCTYYKTRNNGWATEPNQSLAAILAKEKWTHIILQQVSSLSGIKKDLSPYLDNLIKSCIELCPNKKMKFVWNMTQPYAQGHGFGSYGSQDIMYRQILGVAEEVKNKYGLKVIPTGVAIQYARATSLNSFGEYGSQLSSDGSHLDDGIGRLLASYAWLSYFDIDIWGLDYYPTYPLREGIPGGPRHPFITVTQDNAYIAKKCANAANVNSVLSPSESGDNDGGGEVPDPDIPAPTPSGNLVTEVNPGFYQSNGGTFINTSEYSKTFRCTNMIMPARGQKRFKVTIEGLSQSSVQGWKLLYWSDSEYIGYQEPRINDLGYEFALSDLGPSVIKFAINMSSSFTDEQRNSISVVCID